MKKIGMVLFAMALLNNSEAQYKKASFFTRNGKFIGVKAGMHIYGHGVATTPSIAYIYGKDRGNKHVWHWWDLEYTGGSKYSYTTVNLNAPSTMASVNGKIRGMLTWRYNWSYYLGDNTNEEIKGLPFVKLACEVVLAGRGGFAGSNETITPNNASPEIRTYQEGANGGLDAGAGYLYKLNEGMNIFGVAGYRWILNDANYPTFFTTPSHPYINFGIRFSRKNND